MRALAWDDEPEYFLSLKSYLERYDIEVVATDHEDSFSHKFVTEPWNFVLLDLVRKDHQYKGGHEEVGIRLARRVANNPRGRDLPIFIVTQHFDRLSAAELELPRNVMIKSKSTRASWLAGEIYEELVARGMYTNRKKVFLIYGHDHNTDGARGRVQHFLREHGIEVVGISGTNLYTEIAQGLLERMNECAGIIALCTPDDAQADGTFYPRQNVLLEMGMALGLSRGLHRLTILQRWGPAKEDQALLPSDLGGILAIRFEGRIEHQFTALEQRLKELDIAFIPKS